jgi:ferredoxin
MHIGPDPNPQQTCGCATCRAYLEQIQLRHSEDMRTRTQPRPIDLHPTPKCQWVNASPTSTTVIHPCQRRASYRVVQKHYEYDLCVTCAHRVVSSTSAHIEVTQILGTTETGRTVLGITVHRTRRI